MSAEQSKAKKKSGRSQANITHINDVNGPHTRRQQTGEGQTARPPPVTVMPGCWLSGRFPMLFLRRLRGDPCYLRIMYYLITVQRLPSRLACRTQRGH